MRRLLLAFLMLSPGALAETFGGLSFEAPEGWQRQEQSGGLVFTRALPAGAGRNARPGQAMIAIARPGAQAGLFEAALSAWTRAPEQLAEARPRVREGETVEGGRFRIEERSRTRPSLRAVHIGMEHDGRRALLTLLLVNPPRDAARQARAEFAALVRSLRLNGDGRGFVLEPPRGAGALEGHYTRMETRLVPNAFGGMDYRADMRSLTFAPDGRFIREPPAPEGVAAACAETPQRCGTYALSGRDITLLEVEDEFGRVSRRRVPLAREANGIELDGTRWRLVAPFEPGTRLEGVWRYSFASSGSTAFSSGSVAVERSLTLSRDGTWRRTGWAGASSTSEVGGGRSGVTTSAPRPDSGGRYEIAGHVLTLRDAAGGEERFSIFRGDPGSENMLVINGQNYLRR